MSDAKSEWPLEIKSGSAVVKIYQTEKANGYVSYAVVYYVGHEQKTRFFQDLSETKSERKSLADAITQREHISLELTAIVPARSGTDEHGAYRNPLKLWKAHHRVVHCKGEYQRKNADGSIATTNSAESFFSLLKRGVYGAWHHVSKEHLPKYANEFAFRWSTREMTDGQRMETAMGLTTGKRLTYRQVI
jgi:hypothetical protein